MPARSAPSFLIVGTPRSGTTLLQRLTAELPGVAVTPETHFFPLIHRELGGLDPFPGTALTLPTLLRAYCNHRLTGGLGLTAERLEARLPSRSVSPYEVFCAVVAELGLGASIVGEKTPHHLHWWRPLAAADPHLKFVCVVRDPRAVAASMLNVPFGMNRPFLTASQWMEDLHEVEKAQAELSGRVLRIRFEDMVQDPAGTKQTLGAFLGVDPDLVAHTSEVARPLFPEWERAWKARALGPVSTERVEAWRSQLSASQVAEVEAVAREGLVDLRYETATVGRATIGLADRLRLRRHQHARRRRQSQIERARVGSFT